MSSIQNIPAAVALALVSLTAVPAVGAETDVRLVAQATETVVIDRIDAISKGTFVELLIATQSKQRLLPLIFTDQDKLIIEIDNARLAAGFPATVTPSGDTSLLQAIAVEQAAVGSVRITLTAAGNQVLKASVAQSGEGKVALSIQTATDLAGAPEQQDIELVATGEQPGFLEKDAGTALGYREKVLNTPFSIQSVNQDVMQKQQVITIGEALRNVSSGATIAFTSGASGDQPARRHR